MSDWISCEDRLPPDNQNVLAFVSCGVVEMAYRKNGRWFLCWLCSYVPDSTYTHWMPMPKGPSGEETE